MCARGLQLSVRRFIVLEGRKVSLLCLDFYFSEAIALRRRSPAARSPFYCYFFSHVVCHCFTRNIKGSYTVMRMPSTTNSSQSEIAIVGQPQPLICCINLVDIFSYYKTYWRVLVFISTYSFILWNEIFRSKIGPINISRIQWQNQGRHQSWKMTLGHI